MPDEDEEGDGDGDDDVDEMDGDKMQLDVQADVKMSMGDVGIPPEGTAAAKKTSPKHGDEHVIADKLHNLTLDQEIQEASPASKAKLKLMKSDMKPEEVKSPKKSIASPLKSAASPVKSPKKPITSPLKKQQSKG